MSVAKKWQITRQQHDEFEVNSQARGGDEVWPVQG
jgi:hypothetical protein